MGYTNHCYRVLEFDRKKYQAAVSDLKRILPETGVDLASFDGTGDPTVDGNDVRFNGRSPQDCESFSMPRVFDDRPLARDRKLPGFTFSKTNHLPYDLAVKVSLLVFKRHFAEDVEIGSNDEDLLAGWNQAIELAHCVLGYPKSWKVEEWEEDSLTHRHLVHSD
jgi:hypothetical protein